MYKPAKHPAADDNREKRVPGDPGVGGLISDPLEPSGPHDKPDPDAGRQTPDPEPPRHHGDWMPPKKDTARARGHRLAAIMRRKSRSGMPRALFREEDDTSLDDLKALALAHRHQYALKPLSAGRVTTRRNAI
jgi:hypothetical protein